MVDDVEWPDGDAGRLGRLCQPGRHGRVERVDNRVKALRKSNIGFSHLEQRKRKKRIFEDEYKQLQKKP
jgi:hypothetical protein